MNSANLFEDRHCFLNSFTFSSLNAVVKHFLFSILRWLVASDVLEEGSIFICDVKLTPTRYLMLIGTFICRAIWRAFKINRHGRYIASCQHLRMGTVVLSVRYLKFLKPSANLVRVIWTKGCFIKFSTIPINPGISDNSIYWHITFCLILTKRVSSYRQRYLRIDPHLFALHGCQQVLLSFRTSVLEE